LLEFSSYCVGDVNCVPQSSAPALPYVLFGPFLTTLDIRENHFIFLKILVAIWLFLAITVIF
jgi:hypothetical protein